MGDMSETTDELELAGVTWDAFEKATLAYAELLDRTRRYAIERKEKNPSGRYMAPPSAFLSKERIEARLALINAAQVELDAAWLRMREGMEREFLHVRTKEIETIERDRQQDQRQAERDARTAAVTAS